MLLKRSLLSAGLTLLFATGSVFAQARTCPRTGCPNAGQNCPRNGQGMRRGGNTAQRGPAAMTNNRGMRRGRMMSAGCGAAAASTPATSTPTAQENKK